MYSTDVPVRKLLIQKWPPAPGGRTAMPHGLSISGSTICGWKLDLLATRIVWTKRLPCSAVVVKPRLAISPMTTTAFLFICDRTLSCCFVARTARVHYGRVTRRDGLDRLGCASEFL